MTGARVSRRGEISGNSLEEECRCEGTIKHIRKVQI